MQIMAMPRGWQRLALDDLPRERWRNGAGWTRPIAHAEAHGELRWRVSLAEIRQAAPFSRFPGLDRTAVLAAGGPVQLDGPDRHWRLDRPGDQAVFAGETEIANGPPQHEARIWNVMVRRGGVPPRVQTLDLGSAPDSLVLPAQGTVLAWLLQGSVTVHDARDLPLTTLEAQEGLLGHAPDASSVGRAAIALRPMTAGTRLLLTQLA